LAITIIFQTLLISFVSLAPLPRPSFAGVHTTSFSFVSVCALHSHAFTFVSCQCAPSIRMPHPNSTGRAFSLAPTLLGPARGATATPARSIGPKLRPLQHVPSAARSVAGRDPLPILRCTARPVPRGPSASSLRYGRAPFARTRTRMASESPKLTSRRGARPRPSRRDPWHRHSDTAGLPRPDPDSDGIRVTNATSPPTGPGLPRLLPGLG
jgi:hypothetical protein